MVRNLDFVSVCMRPSRELAWPRTVIMVERSSRLISNFSAIAVFLDHLRGKFWPQEILDDQERKRLIVKRRLAQRLEPDNGERFVHKKSQLYAGPSEAV